MAVHLVNVMCSMLVYIIPLCFCNNRKNCHIQYDVHVCICYFLIGTCILMLKYCCMHTQVNVLLTEIKLLVRPTDVVKPWRRMLLTDCTCPSLAFVPSVQ